MWLRLSRSYELKGDTHQNQTACQEAMNSSDLLKKALSTPDLPTEAPSQGSTGPFKTNVGVSMRQCNSG